VGNVLPQESSRAFRFKVAGRAAIWTPDAKYPERQRRARCLVNAVTQLAEVLLSEILIWM
jgi:hypothetical protein